MLALLLLAGQLQQLPAAVACSLPSERPASECGSVPVSGPAVSPARDHHQAPCDLVGACAAPVAVVVPSGLSPFGAGLLDVAVQSPSGDYPGLDSQPIPPPPQA
jgi:hypothetical protein